MKKFQALVKEVETAEVGGGLDEACQQLQQLVAELKLAKAALQQACAPPTKQRLVGAHARCSPQMLIGCYVPISIQISVLAMPILSGLLLLCCATATSTLSSALCRPFI